jgi:hypothetical protein
LAAGELCGEFLGSLMGEDTEPDEQDYSVLTHSYASFADEKHMVKNKS